MRVPPGGIYRGNVLIETSAWFPAAEETRLPVLVASVPTHLTDCLTGVTEATQALAGPLEHIQHRMHGLSFC